MVYEQIGYQLKRAQHALRLVMDAALRPLGLTTAQYAALTALETTPGASNAALARACFVTPQTMHTLVLQLEADGLVVRHAHPAHGRVIQTTLTVVGQQQVAAAHQVVQQIEQQMVASLSMMEQQQFRQWLQHCTDTLERERLQPM